MRILLAGATGALGKQLLPRLVARGHEVAGMTRSESKQELVRDLGGTPLVADALDRDAVTEAVRQARARRDRPPAHGAAVVAGHPPLRPRLRADQPAAHRGDRQPAGGRPRGRDRALRDPELRRLALRPRGEPREGRGRPARPRSAAQEMAESHAAIRYLEDAVIERRLDRGNRAPLRRLLRARHVARPARAASRSRLIRKRKFPLVGDGAGVWSFVHIEDAADATVAAVERGRRGIYHVVDDEPAPVAEWLPAVAEAAGAKPPRHVPRWLGRLLAGEAGAVMMTEVRGASNAKAKRELDWRPSHPSWREGFRATMTVA